MAELFDHLHAGIASTEELLRELHDFLRRHRSSARGALVAADSDKESPIAVMQRRLPSCEVLWQSRAGSLLRLSREIKAEGKTVTIRGKALIVPTAHPRLFLALTADSPKFASRALRPLIDKCSPRIFVPRITSKSVGAILHHAATGEGLDHFEITDVSARSRMEHRRGKRIRSERMRTGETLEEALSLLKERGQWIHSAAFNYVIRSGERKLRGMGRISRECSFTVGGEFTWFHKNVIRPAAEEVVTTMKFYAKRARSNTPNNAPRPIVIEYPDAIFSDKSKHQRLIQSLRRLKRTSISVLHANPYFRCALVDFTDGSAYELWILSQGRIIVTPQFRATSASMERVMDHILTDFGEGEVKDFSEAVYA